MVTKKVRKAINKEIPADMTPDSQRPLYDAAVEKEWSEWLSWKAVNKMNISLARRTRRDPVSRRTIVPTRMAFRNKHAGRDANELRKLNLALVRAKARLCLRGFNQHNAHLPERTAVR